VLAIYQLGFMGGAPVGAMVSGVTIGQIGLHGTLVAAAAMMVMIVGGMALLTGAAKME
jgi:hypothetical protein